MKKRPSDLSALRICKPGAKFQTKPYNLLNLKKMEKKTNFFVFTMLWALFFCCAAYGQDRNVSGTVTDADTHAPMAGVTVVVKGSNRGPPRTRKVTIC